MGGHAWVTLATNDAYSLGALVLAHSLRRVGTKHELAVLITPGVTEMMREKLRAVFNLVQEVNVLDSKDQANLALLARPELGITFTKLHCWRLTQYEKCVFVDADTLVVRNCDELFDREELSAAPDVGWPDCFNSGVFVFKPSQDTFASITAFAASKGSFDGGDQGLLNMYFKDWAHKDISKHLPFIYNMCSTATYSYLPAFKQFGEDVRIIHFIGITKPWLQYFDTMTGIVQPPMGSSHLQPLLQLWWNIFCDNVHPQLSAAMATSTLAPIWHNFPRPKPSNQSVPYYPPAPRNPVHYDANYENYERYSDIYIEAPDFTEFKDPWENYSPRDDPYINDVRQNASGEWSGYSSLTDYASKPVNVQHMCNVEEMIKYHEPTGQPQRRHSRVSNYEHKEQQTEVCLINQNIGQMSESRQERWKPEVSIEQRNGHQEHKQEERHDLQIQHGYYTKYERPEEHHERHYEPRDPPHHVQRQDQHHNQQHYHTHQIQHHNQHHHHVHQDQHHNQQHHHAHQDQHHNQQHHHAHQDQHKNQGHHNSNHQDHHHHQQHHHIHHHGQHHHHNQHEHDQIEHHSNHSEHRHFRLDHQTHQQFPSSIVKHEERKHGTMADCQESKNIEHYESHLSDYEQHSQHMGNRIDESYCQRTSDSSEDHKIEQLHDAHRQSEHTHSTAKQTDVQRPESYPLSEPCTDLRNVATQSDPNITGDSLNAGLPGALAQMTLGQPRSAEQIALEEHMRKQSWEQGQIDYMGRDSFDNIWKKICETLSLAPQRQPTPPKEIPKTDESTAESKVRSVDDTDAPAKTAKEATDSTEQIQTCKVPTTENIVPPAQAIDKEAADAPAAEQDVKDKLETVTAKQEIEIDSKKCEVCPTQKPVTLEQTPSIPTTPICQTSDAPVVCPLVLPVKKEDTIVQQAEVAKTEQSEPIACALSKPDVTQPHVQESTKAESAAEGEKTKTCEPCSTTDITSPVPIQVAESVLQAEPKESVSEEPRPIKEEIVSSVEIPVQESVAALSVKPMEPMTSSATCVLRQESTPGQANGSLSADALAKLQSVDTVASPTTVCTIPPVVPPAATVETKPGSQETCPIPVREAPKPEAETGTRIETPSTTAETKEEAAKIQTPKTEVTGQAGTVCTLRTETATVDLPKSEVLASETQPAASVPEAATPVVQVPKCELPKSETAITGSSSVEIPKSEAPKTDVTAPATPIAEPPKCELPVTKATPEPTPIAELSKPESLKSEAAPAMPTAEAPELELPKAKAPSTPVKEVLKCELSAAKVKQATAVEPLKTETPATPVTEAPKCEQPQVPPVEPTKTEPVESAASDAPKPSSKAQDAPKPDPLKIPAPMPDTPPSDSSKHTSPKTPESPSETPVRPTRTKELSIPPTPTVTEPTPPTSPPITGDQLDLEAQAKTKKTTKKVLKKSASECESGDGAEGDSEKKTKKTVKKVTKKSKESQEEGAESSGAEKPKKATKVVKKIAKPAQTLGADPSVPETPPPGSSDAPVPPRRKTKSATTTKSSTPGKKDEP